jgi:hypothetical protein
MRDQLHFTVVSTPAEVRHILDLQTSNLPASLSAETMASEGFVTVRHDPAALQRMNDAAPAVIAKDGDQVVGYALVMPREFAPEVPILQPLFELLNGLSWNGTLLRDNPRWFVMGQICVAAGYRGRGVFDGLYSTMKEVYRARYDFTVTEVAERNPRSLRAHERVGFRTLHTYPDITTGEVWRVIVLDL